MPQCPQCNKPLVELTRQCPSCRADLDLLVDYVSGIKDKLGRAEQLTRAGELGEAVWAYLEVLEVDPDNAVARRQIGQVANAVRQFDRTKQEKRWWAKGLLRRRRAGATGNTSLIWLMLVLIVLVAVVAFAIGFFCGHGFISSGS